MAVAEAGAPAIRLPGNRTGRRRRPLAAVAAGVAALVSPLLMTGADALAEPAAPAATGYVSKSEKRGMTVGKTKRWVRGHVGSAGSRNTKSGHVEVRQYSMCQGTKSIVVKYRHGRVAKRWTLGSPTNSVPSQPGAQVSPRSKRWTPTQTESPTPGTGLPRPQRRAPSSKPRTT